MSAGFAFQCNSPRLAFDLVPGIYVLGRSSKSDLVVKDETISRQHAKLVVKECAIEVRDLCSRNGTYVNGVRVGAAEVSGGDQVCFGNVAFTIAARDEDVPGSEVETAKSQAVAPAYQDAQWRLSAAQWRVVDLLLEGLAEKRVAARLKLSAATVHNHIQAIYRICNVHSRSELLVALLGKRR